MKARYAHTNIIARDWRRLAGFYEQVFGCQPVPPQRQQSGEWLARGTGVPDAALEGMHLRLPGHGDSGPTLEIFSYATTLPRGVAVAANREGFAHIAFAVDDVAAAAAAVVAAGGSLVGELVERTIPEVGRLSFVYAADPEGNLIELQSWAPLGGPA
jgi:predicted enzyme related to lactoylglutathione lyase